MFKLKRDKMNGDVGEQKTFVASALVAHTSDWIVDSGCTSHMCTNKDWLNELKVSNNCVSIANNDRLQSQGIGNINMKLVDTNIKVVDVMYVPQLSTNLLSVSKMADKGITVVFNKKGCFIYDLNCKVIGACMGTATNVNGVYKLNGVPCTNTTSQTRLLF